MSARQVCAVIDVLPAGCGLDVEIDDEGSRPAARFRALRREPLGASEWSGRDHPPDLVGVQLARTRDCAMSVAAPALEPLVLAEASAASGVDEDVLGMAVALALLPGGPDEAAPGWWDDAPCAGLDPNQFYPGRGCDTRPLRAICDGCPVKSACLGSALYNGEREGWWGGRALSSHDDELSARLATTRRQLGTRVQPAVRLGAALRRRAAHGLLRSRVEMHVPGGATGDLAGAMALHLVREATPSWDEAYGRLLDYVAETGALPGQGTKVPDDSGTFSLGAWCTVQRTLRRRGLLAKERTQALEAVGCWRWDPRDEGWWAKFDLLREFMVTHGRDPHHLEEWRGQKPGLFLNSCRAARTDHDGHRLNLYPDRIAALEAIPGWCWNTKDRQWDESFAKLERWVADHGSADPTASDSIDGFLIGRWCNKQRSRIREGSLRDDRIARLRALPGWVDDYFAVYDAAWDEGLLHLRAFVEAHGRLPPQKETYAGFKVGSWASRQRQNVIGSRPRSTMTADRIRRLDVVPGWVWDTDEAAWEENLDKLFAFAIRHHREGQRLRLPAPLASWATGQRMAHRRGRLAADRVEALERVPGWTWNARPRAAAS